MFPPLGAHNKKTPQEEESLFEGLQKTQENPMTVDPEKEKEKEMKIEQEQGEEMRPEGLQKTQENPMMEEQPSSQEEDQEKSTLKKVLSIVKDSHARKTVELYSVLPKYKRRSNLKDKGKEKIQEDKKLGNQYHFFQR